ncbi:ABC transporter ATP-binding protein [Paeniglutamicibacter kerguelensis]|uniref:ATP-binding cassette subfamily B protein n=1 Tax=Paeniglutamicibacter kerguelensis TaxID=254788 RepID=A0ABS4XJB0_9MICC|nr:ABC transporter ATP-binding protein [Paeniglutamicibacter kerguelensis]MBP2388559.1 ATP-binding cassette subfamily B protein [Paeniglutamicibacter kerguelensis]
MSDQRTRNVPPRPMPGPGGRGPRFGPSLPAEKALNFMPSARKLARRLKPHRLGLLGMLLLSMASVGFSVLGPKLLGQGTNLIFEGAMSQRLPAGVTQEQVIEGLRAAGRNSEADLLSGMHLTPGTGIDLQALSRILLVVLALYMLSSIFGWLQAYVLNEVVQRTMYSLRQDVEGKINRLPLGYYDKMQRGELLSRVTNDIDNVSQSLQQTFSQMVTSLLTVVGVVTMMLIVSPLMTVIAVVTIPLTILITAVVAKRSQKLFVAQWKHTGELNADVEENYTGHSLVKVFGRQREVRAVFDAKNKELYRASFGAQFVSGIIQPAMMFVGNLIYVAIAVVGGMQVAAGAMRLGDVQAFLQYSRQFTQPLAQLGSMANLIQSGVASAERVFELLEADEQSRDSSPAQSPAAADGKLVFEDVCFRYTPDKPLIENVSLTARPGHTIAIVGPTGAGKTTLVNLIMRFYELDSGCITLDGVDIAMMTRDDLRGRMGMVLQDTWLFSGTIRENIAYGRPDATEEEIIDAATATYVDRFVRSLPDGYDTVLTDAAENVSAGEKQLITIARAFLAKPSVLILDEATSSVDTRTEVLVQKAMAALRSDRTSFVIAHRLSTIRDADLILVMDAGQIVEQGNHTELLAARGAYFELYNAQFAVPVAENI